MDRKIAKHAPKAISELAERQHGVIATAQLYSLGLSETQIAVRVRNGWLHRVHRGVYSVGRRSLTPNGHWMAAVLASGESAVLSHQAAGGIPVTTPARTLLDLATVLTRRQFERAMDEAERLNICNEDDLEAIAGEHCGRAGAGILGAMLRDHRAGATATRNDLGRETHGTRGPSRPIATATGGWPWPAIACCGSPGGTSPAAPPWSPTGSVACSAQQPERALVNDSWRVTGHTDQ